MLAIIIAAGLRSDLIDTTFLLVSEELARTVFLLHFHSQRRIVLRILPAFLIGKQLRTFLVFDENLIVFVLLVAPAVEALEKIFGIFNRADDEVTIGNLAAARCIATLAKAIGHASVMRDFGLDRFCV